MFKIAESYNYICGLINDFRSILKGNVGNIALSWFLFGISGSLTGPFFMLYAKSLGADDFSIAIIRSTGMVALAFSTIIGGFLTDYIGRVKTIVVGTGLVAIVSYAYAFVTNWVQLSILWIVDQAAHFYVPALTAIIMDSMPRDKTLRGFLVLNAFTAVPGLFMPIIGGVMYDKYGLAGIRYAFIMSGIVATVVLYLRIKFLRETLVGRVNNNGFKSMVFDILKYKSVLKKAVFIYIYTSVIGPVVSAVSATYGSIYVVELLKISKTELGLLSSIGTFTSITTSIVLASFRNINDKLAIILSSLSLTISMAFFTIPGFIYRDIMMYLIMSAIFGSIHGALIGPILSTIMTRLLPVEVRGRVIGFQRMFENIGASLASIYAGVLYVYLGPIHSLLVSTLTSLIVLPYLMFLRKLSGQVIFQ